LASDKQTAANRANARKSTGPKTAAGKLKSGQNARRHGLSSPLRLDPATFVKAETLARALAGNDENGVRLKVATDLAHAQLKLDQIQTIRADLMGTFDPYQPQIPQLQRIAALDRHERYALTNRRRAARTL